MWSIWGKADITSRFNLRLPFLLTYTHYNLRSLLCSNFTGLLVFTNKSARIVITLLTESSYWNVKMGRQPIKPKCKLHPPSAVTWKIWILLTVYLCLCYDSYQKNTDFFPSTALTDLQGVPLATKPGIPIIILTPMKILQRNLDRNTFFSFTFLTKWGKSTSNFVAISSLVVKLLKKCRVR
jgi:hypothetical protein